jgi:hypothetical protein
MELRRKNEKEVDHHGFLSFIIFCCVRVEPHSVIKMLRNSGCVGAGSFRQAPNKFEPSRGGFR